MISIDGGQAIRFRFLMLVAAVSFSLAGQTEKPKQERLKDSTDIPMAFGALSPKDKEWKPLTNKERWQLYYTQAFLSPVGYFRPLIPSAISTASNDPPEWHGTIGGFGKRYGTNFVTFTLQDTFETAGASLFGHDTRFINCRCTGAWPRTRHALLQTFLTYNDQGKWTFAGPRIFANYGASAVTTYAFMPDRLHNFWQVARSGNSQFYWGTIFNILKEFRPELMRPLQRFQKNKSKP